MKLHLNENNYDWRNREYAESGEWYADLWTAYIDDTYTCACCGKKFPAGHNSVYLDGHKPDGMHFIYKYTKDNRVGNSINYDPYNLPPEDEEGGIFKVIVCNENDDEGYYWRNFCRNCWPKLTKYTPAELAAKFEPADFVESFDKKLVKESATVTTDNFEDKVFEFMETGWNPPSKYAKESFELAAKAFVETLDDSALANLANDSDNYEFDEMYLMDEIAYRTGVDFNHNGEFDENLYQKAIDSLVSKNESVKEGRAGRPKLKPKDKWVHDDAYRYSLMNGKNGDIESSNNKTELIRKCKQMSDPAWVEDNMLGGIEYSNKAQSDIDNGII